MTQSDVQNRLAEIAELKRKGESGSYLSVAEELGELNNALKSELPKMKLQQASDVMQAFYPLVFNAMIELCQKDEAIRERLQRAEDVTYWLKVPEVHFGLSLKLEHGQFSYLFGEPPAADITMATSPDSLIRIMTGQTDALEAFMNGEVQVEGQLLKARGLRVIFETMGDKFGLRLMEFPSYS